MNMQLNLNSAEKENILIKESLANQLRAIATEWDRMLVKQAGRGPMQGMTMLAQSFRNLLAVFNTPIGSFALTGILAAVTALAAKMLIMRSQHAAMAAGARAVAGAQEQQAATGKQVDQITQFMINSQQRFAQALGAVNQKIMQINANAARYIGTTRMFVGEFGAGLVMKDIAKETGKGAIAGATRGLAGLGAMER